MIEEKNIRKLCGNNAVFNRGMDLYLDGNVKNIRYERKNRDKVRKAIKWFAALSLFDGKLIVPADGTLLPAPAA